MATPYTIPKGKTLSIMQGKTAITNVPLILEEEVTLSLSSSFKPIFGGGNTKVDIAGATVADIFGKGYGFSSRFKEFGYQFWENTDPLSFNATITFHMGILGLYRGRIEVYEPAIALSQLPLPRTGQTAGNGTLENLIAPGPPPTSLLNIDGYKGKYQKISLQIGNVLYVNDIIVKRAEPTFSTESDDEGYPIWSKVNLDIQSVETATVEMLSNRINPNIGA